MIEFAKVDPATIAQFTGLRDKNGKEIFEGDIVEWRIEVDPSTPSGTVRETCRFENGGFYPRVGAHECEVVGNIYETPELLRV